jgi:hypothetical protein
MHICNPSTGRLRQEDHLGLHSETLSQRNKNKSGGGGKLVRQEMVVRVGCLKVRLWYWKLKDLGL